MVINHSASSLIHLSHTIHFYSRIIKFSFYNFIQIQIPFIQFKFDYSRIRIPGFQNLKKLHSIIHFHSFHSFTSFISNFHSKSIHILIHSLTFRHLKFKIFHSLCIWHFYSLVYPFSSGLFSFRIWFQIIFTFIPFIGIYLQFMQFKIYLQEGLHCCFFLDHFIWSGHCLSFLTELFDFFELFHFSSIYTYHIFLFLISFHSFFGFGFGLEDIAYLSQVGAGGGGNRATATLENCDMATQATHTFGRHFSFSSLSLSLSPSHLQKERQTGSGNDRQGETGGETNKQTGSGTGGNIASAFVLPLYPPSWLC